MSKLETGMIRLCPQKASLQKTLAKAVAGVYVKAMEKGISIETQEFDDILICHDPGWTAEAFANVLDNGVKYAPSKTRITIRVTKMASLVMVEMEDEGPGIPARSETGFFSVFTGASPKVSAERKVPAWAFILPGRSWNGRGERCV